MPTPTALYQRDGSVFIPSVLTRGPWSPDAQHGSAPGALLATCADQMDSGEGMTIARLTVELLRPVPLTPLSVETEVERPGRKVQLLGLSLRAGEKEVARARVLRIRTTDLELPETLSEDTPPPPLEQGVASLPSWDLDPERLSFHSHAVEHRFVGGSFNRPGPGVDWIKLQFPIVEGEEILPVARAIAAADFGNGVSWELDRKDGYSFINPDLTVYLNRMPSSEAVCLEARSRYQPNGVGLAESLLWDERGSIGRSVQSLLVDQQD